MDSKHRYARISIAIAAGILLVWSIATLWFGRPGLSQGGLRANAITIICIWALGPAVWFVIEGWIWKSEPNLSRSQQHERDFWLGLGAIILILAIRGLNGSSAQPVYQATLAWYLLVDAIRVTIWPLVAIVGFFLFREPLSAFFKALGTRASKIGAFAVSIELASLPEAKPWSGPALEDLRSEYPAAATDSSGSLFTAIADTTQADYITVDLEDGEAWLTSRLFILATLIPRVRPIKRIVFLRDPAQTFVGETTPAAVTEALAGKYRWLEEAYIAAHVQIKNLPVQVPNPPGPVPNPPVPVPKPPPPEVILQADKTLLGRLNPKLAGMILSSFLAKVKVSKVKSDPAPTGWADLGHYAERAEWVSVESLVNLLGTKVNGNAVKLDPSLDETTVTRTLLRHRSQFVALVDGFGKFEHLIDRHGALDQVVRRETAQAG